MKGWDQNASKFVLFNRVCVRNFKTWVQFLSIFKYSTLLQNCGCKYYVSVGLFSETMGAISPSAPTLTQTLFNKVYHLNLEQKTKHISGESSWQYVHENDYSKTSKYVAEDSRTRRRRLQKELSTSLSVLQIEPTIFYPLANQKRHSEV